MVCSTVSATLCRNSLLNPGKPGVVMAMKSALRAITDPVIVVAGSPTAI